jgi:hypothetical protein
MSLPGKILALVNFLAAGLFVYLAVVNHAKRQSWAHAVALHDRAIDGLPLDDQRKELERIRKNRTFLSAVDEAAKKTAADARGREAQVVQKLLPALALTGNDLAKWQARLKAGKDLGQVTEDAARRWMLSQALLPLEESRFGGRREQLAADLADPDHKYADFEKLLDARIDDLLRPQVENNPRGKAKDAPRGMELQLVTTQSPQFYVVYRRSPQDRKVSVWLMNATSHEPAGAGAGPVTLRVYSEPDQPQFEMTREGTGYSAKDNLFGDANKVLRGEVDVTSGGKPLHFWFIEHEPIHYREQVAHLLFTLSQVTRPDQSKLDAPSETQVEQWVGRRMYVDAIRRQTKVLNQITERRLVDAEHDLAAFADHSGELLRERLPYLRMAIERQRGSLARWEKDRSDREKELEADQENYKSAVEQLKQERTKANEALAELAKWQERLLDAQKADAGLGAENRRLERAIREKETGRDSSKK